MREIQNRFAIIAKLTERSGNTRLSILGCGRWATFLAWYLSKNGHEVALWGRPGSDSLENLRRTRCNSYVSLDENVILTDDLTFALGFGGYTLISISAQQLRALYASFPSKPRSPLVLCMKGLEETTGLRLTQVTAECLGYIPCAVWVGPGHPEDFTRGIPNCMVIDSSDPELTRSVADNLGSNLIRFYYGEDLIGAEIGAASKNVIGIAAGFLDGLGLSSLKGVLMARGAREISRLTKKLGGQEITIYGICHLGDYEATLFSSHSHNRAFGERFIHGENYGLLAEGVATARSLCKISQDIGVDLPICRAVDDVLAYRQKPGEALGNLFLRSVKPEFYMERHDTI